MQARESSDFAGWALDAQGFLASILECVAQPVWVVDHGGLIVFANPVAISTLGYDSLEELLGRHSHETIHYSHPDGRPFPASECPMLRPRTTGETVRSDEDWFFRKDGTMFAVSYVSTPIETPSGLGAVVAFTDIGERVQVEQARRESQVMEARNAELRASELRYRAILEAAFDAIVSIDGQTRVTYMNRAALHTFGYSLEEVLGQDLVPLIVPPRLQERYRSWWLDRQREDQEVLARANEAWAMSSDGREFKIEFAVARMTTPGAIGYTTYYRDLTDRVRIEWELRQARRRVIEAADQERRRIARDLHDGAQQQLVGVAFNLELAAQQLSGDPARARESIELARDEARAGTAALRELVAGIHPAILTNRGLAAAATSLTARMPLPVRLDELHEPRLDSRVEAGAYFVICEALTNVVKHANASEAIVRTLVADGQLLVTVTDDGDGGADAARGTGLTGLSDRVAALNGALQIASPPGKGTTLSCRIPLAQRPDPPSGKVAIDA